MIRFGNPNMGRAGACQGITRTPYELRNKYLMWPLGIGNRNTQYMEAYGIPIVGRYTQYLDVPDSVRVWWGVEV